MNEIKPNWSIAQQVSRQHTLISFSISLPLFLALIILSIIALKLAGFENAGLVLRHFFEGHIKIICYSVLFIHFVPINFYAIIRVLSANYRHFEIKVFSK